MEVPLQQRTRTLKHCYQCCRIEEQIWKLAYEHLCPQTRRPITATPADVKRPQIQRRVIKEDVA